MCVIESHGYKPIATHNFAVPTLTKQFLGVFKWNDLYALIIFMSSVSAHQYVKSHSLPKAPRHLGHVRNINTASVWQG